MEGLQKKIDALVKLLAQVEHTTSVEISVDIQKTLDVYEENEEYFYTLFLHEKDKNVIILKEVSHETAYNYLKGILIGYEYAIQKQLLTLCRN